MLEMNDVELLDLGLTDEDIKQIGTDMIGYKKQINDILAKSRKQAKKKMSVLWKGSK